MTEKTHHSSGLNRGMPILISAEWTPEQAWAVFELLDDLRDAIWNHYAPDIQHMVQNQQASDDNQD